MSENGNSMEESESEKSQSLLQSTPSPLVGELEKKVVKLNDLPNRPLISTINYINSSSDCSKTKFECCPDGVTPAKVRKIGKILNSF